MYSGGGSISHFSPPKLSRRAGRAEPLPRLHAPGRLAALGPSRANEVFSSSSSSSSSFFPSYFSFRGKRELSLALRTPPEARRAAAAAGEAEAGAQERPGALRGPRRREAGDSDLSAIPARPASPAWARPAIASKRAK